MLFVERSQWVHHNVQGLEEYDASNGWITVNYVQLVRWKNFQASFVIFSTIKRGVVCT